MRTRLHDWLIGTWYGGTGRGRWLLPLAWLYAAILCLCRVFVTLGWLRRYRSRRAVVVVGNVTAGGTGKTPLVAWLARELGGRGARVGIASRGYRGRGGPPRLVGAEEAAATAGDEPFLLRRKLGVPVAIAVRRGEAVRLLEDSCDIILCDDGLQHRALARDFEIAVVDGSRGLGNGRLLPAGPLREPASRLDAVDAVVVNGPGFDRASAIRMQLQAVAAVSLRDGSRRPLASFSGSRAIAAAAIGNPGRFFDLLRSHGIEIDARSFPDHATIAPAALGPRDGRPVLMTEKDAVKCTGPGWDDAWYVEVEARFDPAAAAALLGRIESTARRRGTTDRE